MGWQCIRCGGCKVSWSGMHACPVPVAAIPTLTTAASANIAPASGPDWSAYAALSNERDLLKRRVEELTGTNSHESQTVKLLRERVKDLEAIEAKQSAHIAELRKSTPPHIVEDLARKREECGRLELLASDMRQTVLRIGQERDDARRELGAAQADNAKLRRELRSKR